MSERMPPKSQRLQAICSAFPIDALYVFGSRAQEIAGGLAGELVQVSKGPSDVDIGVQVRRGERLGAEQRVELTIRLEDLLEVPRVDLVVVQEAEPFLALDIIRGELLYCADPLRQAEYELYVLRRAADLAPFERLRRHLILYESAR